MEKIIGEKILEKETKVKRGKDFDCRKRVRYKCILCDAYVSLSGDPFPYSRVFLRFSYLEKGYCGIRKLW